MSSCFQHYHNGPPEWRWSIHEPLNRLGRRTCMTTTPFKIEIKNQLWSSRQTHTTKKKHVIWVARSFDCVERFAFACEVPWGHFRRQKSTSLVKSRRPLYRPVLP
jgi:hypothetical protein